VQKKKKTDTASTLLFLARALRKEREKRGKQLTQKNTAEGGWGETRSRRTGMTDETVSKDAAERSAAERRRMSVITDTTSSADAMLHTIASAETAGTRASGSEEGGGCSGEEPVSRPARPARPNRPPRRPATIANRVHVQRARLDSTRAHVSSEQSFRGALPANVHPSSTAITAVTVSANLATRTCALYVYCFLQAFRRLSLSCLATALAISPLSLCLSLSVSLSLCLSVSLCLCLSLSLPLSLSLSRQRSTQDLTLARTPPSLSLRCGNFVYVCALLLCVHISSSASGSKTPEECVYAICRFTTNSLSVDEPRRQQSSR
jgi:hypothetical protein